MGDFIVLITFIIFRGLIDSDSSYNINLKLAQKDKKKSQLSTYIE
jgi:hypothetical protein